MRSMSPYSGIPVCLWCGRAADWGILFSCHALLQYCVYDTELQLKSLKKILIGVQYHTIFSITGRDWIIKAFN